MNLTHDDSDPAQLPWKVRSEPEPMSSRQFSKITTIIGLVGVGVSAVALYFGLYAIGGGDGIYWPWMFGIVLALLSGLSFLISLITGIFHWIRHGRSTPWIFLDMFLLALIFIFFRKI